MTSRIVIHNNGKIDFERIKVKDIEKFTDAMVVLPEKSIDLREKRIGLITHFSFTSHQDIGEGDTITIRGINLNSPGVRTNEGKDALYIGIHFDEVVVNERAERPGEKVLSWINGSRGFRLHASDNGHNQFFSFISESEEEEDMHIPSYKVDNLEIITDELEKSGNIIHPGIFLSETRYKRIFERLVRNKSAEEYDRIDDADNSKSQLREVVIDHIYEANKDEEGNYKLSGRQNEGVENEQQNIITDDNINYQLQNLTITEIRTKTIELITKTLSNSQLTNNDLEVDNRDWRRQIERLEELIEEAKKLTDYQELATKLKQINDFYGQRIYEEKITEINALKKRLADLNPEQYSRTNEEMIDNELNKGHLNQNDLDSEAQAALDKLKNGTEKDPSKIDELKNIVSNSIGTKVALNKLDKLLEEYEKIPSTEPERKKAAKKKIIEFYSQIGSDLFHKKAYEARQQAVDEILGISQQQTDSPVIPLVIVGSLFLSLIAALI
ncbi:19187_t:CDS:2 [Entrophospora sp. SA101]|nr:12695_t:CDS:2 [Entrophospora sp. SA101]CAJ0748932.1 19187_t:CDS:2 [Entrophospora sp. SA101]CAJ0869157.1 11264_t:CDS:2 [Entrophospora sp. SA101]